MPTISNAATVTVSDTGSLRDAYNTLSRSGGGTIEVSQGNRPIEIALSGGGRDQVNITSANDAAPTLLHRISFDKVENVTVSDFRIDSSDVSRPDWHKDLMVSGSKNIVIEDSAFSSNATGRYSPGQAGTVLGETLGLVRNTENFSFEGNTAKDYYHGLAVFESIGTSVNENEFSGFQGDGLRLAGVQQTEVSNNSMHNFIGTTRTFNHNDFIQVWSTNTKLLTKDLTISGNTLDSGDGSSAQAIFIGNERYRSGEKDHRYQNIDVFDNVIHSGNTNGIAVSGAKNVDITYNTVLWDASAETLDNSGDTGRTKAPLIRFSNVTDGLIYNNITSGIIAGNGNSLSGNKILNYTQPNDPNYVGSNFVNALGGGGDLNFNLRPDSAWDEVGSSLTRAVTRSDGGVEAIFTADVDRGDFHGFVFDASLSVDERGYLGDEYDFVWTFEDGTVLRGEKVDHVFAEEGRQSVSLNIYKDGQLVDQSDRSIEVQSKTLLDLNLNGSAGDDSSYDSKVTVAGAKAVSDGYQIGGQNKIEIDRSSQQIHDLESFGITMDLKILNGDAGRFLLLHEVMDATVRSNGALQFTLKTDKGTFRVDSGDVAIDDGRFHQLGFDYDGDRLTLYVDGDVVDETAAEGTTAPQGYQHLVLGSNWSAGVDAVVRNLTLTAEPAMSNPDSEGNTPDLPSADVETPPVVVTPEAPEEEPETPVEEPEETPEAEPETPSEELEAPVEEEQETPDTEIDLPPVSPFPSIELGSIVADTDFETTEANSVLSRFDSRALVQSGGDTSYQIGKGHILQLDRSTDGLHGLEAFSLEMDVTADTTDLSGELLHFYKAFEVTTDRDGALRFTLETDEGKFSVATDGNPLADGEEHRLGVVYDDDLGKMSVRVDDQIVAEGEASGVTADGSYWGLTVGHTWSERGSDTFDMLVDEFVLRTRVSDGETIVPTEPLPVPEVQDPTQDEDPGEPSDPITDPNAGEFEIFL